MLLQTIVMTSLCPALYHPEQGKGRGYLKAECWSPFERIGGGDCYTAYVAKATLKIHFFPFPAPATEKNK